jgi:hypothetical protein
LTDFTLADLAGQSLSEVVATASPADLMAFVGPVVTWILVITGWRYVHQKAAARERRKEELAEVNELTKLLATIVDLAVEYYRQAPSDETKKTESTLVRQLQSLQHRAGLLRK